MQTQSSRIQAWKLNSSRKLIVDDYDLYMRMAARLLPLPIPPATPSHPPGRAQTDQGSSAQAKTESSYSARALPLKIYLPDGAPVIQEVVPPLNSSGKSRVTLHSSGIPTRRMARLPVIPRSCLQCTHRMAHADDQENQTPFFPSCATTSHCSSRRRRLRPQDTQMRIPFPSPYRSLRVSSCRMTVKSLGSRLACQGWTGGCGSASS